MQTDNKRESSQEDRGVQESQTCRSHLDFEQMDSLFVASVAALGEQPYELGLVHLRRHRRAVDPRDDFTMAWCFNAHATVKHTMFSSTTRYGSLTLSGSH